MEQELARPERFDLDLRRLRYFVAVADEMHFGRAAAQLYLAQPALSRQIRKLEEELGVELFVRTSRRVELTEAGRELLDAAKPLLAASLAAARRARRAAKGGQRLTIGFFTGDPITSAVRGLAIRRPDVVVDVVRIYWHDQTDSLLNGRVDVALLHLPVTTAGLKLVPLYDAPRVALLHRNHPLADRQEVHGPCQRPGDPPPRCQSGLGGIPQHRSASRRKSSKIRAGGEQHRRETRASCRGSCNQLSSRVGGSRNHAWAALLWMVVLAVAMRRHAPYRSERRRSPGRVLTPA